MTWKYQCHHLLVEIITRDARKSGSLEKMISAVRQELPANEEQLHTLPHTSERLIREIRMGLYSGDISHANSFLIRYHEIHDASKSESPLVNIINNPFDASWFKDLPIYLQLHSLHEISKHCLKNLDPFDSAMEYLLDPQTMESIPDEGKQSLYYLRISNLLLRNQTKRAIQETAQGSDYIASSGLHGWITYLTGTPIDAINSYKSDLQILRNKEQCRNVFFVGPEGLFFILSLLKSNDYAQFSRIKRFVSIVESAQPNSYLIASYQALLAVSTAKLENFQPDYSINVWEPGRKNALTALFQGLSQYWLHGRLDKEQIQELQNFKIKAKQNGYQWIAQEYSTLLSLCSGELFDRTNAISKSSVVSVFKQEEPWQRALKSLEIVGLKTGEHDIPISASRLVWLIHYDNGFISIAPREQKKTIRGTWSKGRSIALKRLAEGAQLDFLSEQDQKICATLYRRHSSIELSYEFNMENTLPLLLGHPLLFLAESPLTPVELLRGEPELLVSKQKNKLLLTFSPYNLEEKTVVIRETTTRFKVITFTAQHRRIAEIIGSDGLLVPASAKAQVSHTLGKMAASLTVHSDIGATPIDIAKVEADPRIFIQILPLGAGFRLSILVKPLGPDGPALRPGHGAKTVIAEIKGKRLHTDRDLNKEKSLSLEIENSCDTLASLSDSSGEWLFDDPQDCLNVLLELEQTKGDHVVVEWPEGEKLSIRQQVSFEKFHVRVHKKQNWFSLDGTLEIDSNSVIDMQHLLHLVSTNPGKFIPIGKGEFIALSKKFRAKLDELASFTEEHGKTRVIHPLASIALEDFAISGSTLETDHYWQNQITKTHEAQQLQPTVPSTLQADLRDYQIEGFIWLARLAHWGVGGCLADDMGLGKTVQALAIILDKANIGPTLVIAPTSVCFNWISEIKRFAPTLNPILFGSTDRESTVLNLKKFDVLIASYGLLQQESKILSSRNWETIVLDEAQAIKNVATKRSKAAMALQGNFKLITTGTPIENHLGELWNLFNFINPGLLGSLEQFNRRFIAPISKQKDRSVLRKLKKLISPFILRRIKSQVLEELPPKTEIILHVDLSEDEAAFYEALRRNALDSIERTTRAGQRQMTILAEIMKLRRTCCDPSLVLPDTTLPSSKLRLFETVISELRANNHKALVFSQFVGYLKIIRAYLDKTGIHYRYLDGSTPAKKRQEEVEAFQAGSGDIFLISLKAGGTGLNLTAADYVIHMDPWWNPAVEDQASNRVHRIGQQHPVTIYRLIVKNTIEEKIVKLHQDKRQLADSLLEGTDVSHRLSGEELMALL
ncbi:MAG: DEAD/DEAH box helicase, partial [Deltaproteobacteria bacterium]|nr:DEAD/DEAH box helicase [Deltaproteobacteria bacterium]